VDFLLSRLTRRKRSIGYTLQSYVGLLQILRFFLFAVGTVGSAEMVVFSILDLEGWLEGRVIIDGCWKRLLFLNTLSPVLKDKLLDSLYSLERRYF